MILYEQRNAQGPRLIDHGQGIKLNLIGKFTPVHPLAMSDALVDEMKASLQRERGEEMHHISKSIYLRQIKLTYSYSASQNLSEKHEEISGGCRGC